jgi:hypothetical protein
MAFVLKGKSDDHRLHAVIGKVKLPPCLPSYRRILNVNIVSSDFGRILPAFIIIPLIFESPFAYHNFMQRASCLQIHHHDRRTEATLPRDLH